MPTAAATGNGFRLTRELSAGRLGCRGPSVVPALRSPHELCAISNRPLRRLPATSDQNTPDLCGLGAAGCLIWMYYEVRGDPAIADAARPPIPDYSRYSYPLDYGEAQVFPRKLAYAWGADLVWRRGWPQPRADPGPARPGRAHGDDLGGAEAVRLPTGRRSRRSWLRSASDRK